MILTFRRRNLDRLIQPGGERFPIVSRAAALEAAGDVAGSIEEDHVRLVARAEGAGEAAVGIV